VWVIYSVSTLASKSSNGIIQADITHSSSECIFITEKYLID
jgi:hypothetical protein